jgi:hypothetical protein
MSNSDITDRADWMKKCRAGERQQMPEHLKEGCLECAAYVLSEVLDLSRPVHVPEELVQAAIRVFPVPPPYVKPSSAPALPILAARFMYKPEDAELEQLPVHADASDRLLDMQSQRVTDSPETVETAGMPSKR